MGKQFIRVPVEYKTNYSDTERRYIVQSGQIWVNGQRYTWNKVINEISKSKEHRMTLIAIVGARGIGKSSFARIMTVQLKNVMVVEVERIQELPLSIRTELDNVIEIHSLPLNQWNPNKKVEGE